MIAETEIVSGTDAQPGYEVSVLLGDWGSFTNKQFRAGITWVLLAKLLRVIFFDNIWQRLIANY